MEVQRSLHAELRKNCILAGDGLSLPTTNLVEVARRNRARSGKGTEEDYRVLEK